MLPDEKTSGKVSASEISTQAPAYVCTHRIQDKSQGFESVGAVVFSRRWWKLSNWAAVQCGIDSRKMTDGERWMVTGGVRWGMLIVGQTFTTWIYHYSV